MGFVTSCPGRGRLLLPVLALLLLGAGALVVYALFAVLDLEEASVRTENIVRSTAIVRTQVVRARTRGASIRRGEMIAAPTTQQEVRAMVEFCDTATPADVAALREVALTAEDPLAAGNAVRALGRLRAVSKDPQLAALLLDGRERVRDETILALGESRDAEAAKLLEPLARGGDAKVRLLAVHAIGRVGGGRARTVLEEIVDAPAATREDQAFARAALATVAR